MNYIYSYYAEEINPEVKEITKYGNITQPRKTADGLVSVNHRAITTQADWDKISQHIAELMDTKANNITVKSFSFLHTVHDEDSRIENLRTGLQHLCELNDPTPTYVAEYAKVLLAELDAFKGDDHDQDH